MAEAAPCPLLRLQNESPLHWIAVHVSQLLLALVFREDNEIVEPRLPDAAPLRRRLPERHLFRVQRSEQTRKQTAGEALLQGFHHRRRISAGHPISRVLCEKWGFWFSLQCFPSRSGVTLLTDFFTHYLRL